jgi:hypothetical protein
VESLVTEVEVRQDAAQKDVASPIAAGWRQEYRKCGKPTYRCASRVLAIQVQIELIGRFEQDVVVNQNVLVNQIKKILGLTCKVFHEWYYQTTRFG